MQKTNLTANSDNTTEFSSLLETCFFQPVRIRKNLSICRPCWTFITNHMYICQAATSSGRSTYCSSKGGSQIKPEQIIEAICSVFLYLQCISLSLASCFWLVDFLDNWFLLSSPPSSFLCFLFLLLPSFLLFSLLYWHESLNNNIFKTLTLTQTPLLPLLLLPGLQPLLFLLYLPCIMQPIPPRVFLIRCI